MNRFLISKGLIGGILVALTACWALACSKGDKGNGTDAAADTFKRNMLVNYADTLILPAYTDLQNKLGLLETAISNFLASPDAGTQTQLRTSFKNAYLAFEGVSALYIGPAASLQFNISYNTFPTAMAKVETAIQTGSYNLTLPIVSDSIQGFPALDYLLFNPDAINQFKGSTAVNRKQYVKDILDHMKTLLTGTISQWQNGFRNNFVDNLKTNVGSPIGSLVNQFAFEMDALKGPRIGYPFGKQSNGIVFADKCEGYFSGITKELAIANLGSLRKFFMGGAGNGIDDYLQLLGKQSLKNDVLAQFDVALNALNAIPAPMSAAFAGNAPAVENAYKEVQKLLTLIKTDVASATAVQITYMDNDGD
ncbi:MAG: imelysin family protein [Candidatus Pseudobacter hemicellulosilyticus]|uniref:Imelysin family protein n=1 Tax=Candidatus Pseudobacter hemicellulosilyticus TaxID=3121375 RepID=A0AAJ6BF27_9BACT|nr:MAG: imelysin family protein [Pseudobacter sp.]